MKQVLPQVMERGTCWPHIYIVYTLNCMLDMHLICTGLRVVEVAHNFQQQVRGYITEVLKLQNSFDTWHGTKYTYLNMYAYCSLVIPIFRYKERGQTNEEGCPGCQGKGGGYVVHRFV